MSKSGSGNLNLGSAVTLYLQVTLPSQILDQTSPQKGLDNGDDPLLIIVAP